MPEVAFFAVRDDLLPALQAVERKRRLHYARFGHYPVDREVEIYDAAVNLPGLGEADADSSVACTKYLVSEQPFVLRQIGTGTVRALDQLHNPDSVALAGGGRRGSALLSGTLSTTGVTAAAKSLFSAYETAFRSFTKINAYYVGPGALALFEAGTRLTAALQSRLEYDLAR